MRTPSPLEGASDAGVRDATPVEADGCAEPAPQRDEERDPSPHAEPDDADRFVSEARGVQVLDRGVDVVEDPVVGEPLEEWDHLVEVAVWRRAATRPVEDPRQCGVGGGHGSDGTLAWQREPVDAGARIANRAKGDLVKPVRHVGSSLNEIVQRCS